VADVSIVLRARDEAAALPEVLEALRSQTRGGAEWIVVDDGSSDATAALARAAGAQVVPVPRGRFSYGGALNLGFAQARAPIAVALSAHAVPAGRQWLEALLRPFADPRVAASFGPELPREDAELVVRRALERRYRGLGQHDLAAGGRLTFGNTNAAIRLEAWRSLPFDAALPYAEDLEWSLRALAAGWRIVYSPSAGVYHSHRDSPSVAFRRAYAEGMAARRLGRRQRHHGTAGLLWTLAGGSLQDAATLAAGLAGPRQWGRALACRWARGLGGWRGYRAGAAPAGAAPAGPEAGEEAAARP
jgi:rhamnosyltransferase